VYREFPDPFKQFLSGDMPFFIYLFTRVINGLEHEYICLEFVPVIFFNDRIEVLESFHTRSPGEMIGDRVGCSIVLL
jgi:hypothetical protein